MRVAAVDLWTGDVVVRHAGIVLALRLIPGWNGPATVEVTLANVLERRGDALMPIEMVEEHTIRYHSAEQVEIVRDRPLPGGYHMTQFDVRGKCHGRAHPALEQRLRAEGRMA